MEKTNKTKRIETTLRLPLDLHDLLARAAAKAGRSINEEVTYRLRAHVQAATLDEIVQQNIELKRMLQQLIDMQD